jgi:NAD(P)-dependent dehydrogenase (short-subunit alcohol dehydrogenase family)
MKKMGKLDARVAIVTAGGAGIGAATVRCLAGEGAAVVVADLSGTRARSWQPLIPEIHGLSEVERQKLAHEVFPLLLTTSAGLEEIDEALRELSDDELRTLVDRAPACEGPVGARGRGYRRRRAPRGAYSGPSLTLRSS